MLGCTGRADAGGGAGLADPIHGRWRSDISASIALAFYTLPAVLLRISGVLLHYPL